MVSDLRPRIRSRSPEARLEGSMTQSLRRQRSCALARARFADSFVTSVPTGTRAALSVASMVARRLPRRSELRCFLLLTWCSALGGLDPVNDRPAQLIQASELPVHTHFWYRTRGVSVRDISFSTACGAAEAARARPSRCRPSGLFSWRICQRAAPRTSGDGRTTVHAQTSRGMADRA